MNFGNTFYLNFLWLVPALIIFYIYSIRKRKILLKKFADINILKRLVNSGSIQKYYLKATLLIIACAFGIFSLSEPKFGYKWEEVKRKGIDIVFAVDVSKSMLAEDVQPSRLERAKMEIKDFLNILQGDRIALVSFAGTSYLQTPLTLDYNAFKLFLDYLDPSLIPIPGTSLSNAIDKSIKAFPDNSSRGKAIILITDGEDLEEGINNVISKLKEKEIRVFTLGIGSSDGVPIPTPQGLKKDNNGNVVLTKLDTATLNRLANETGGVFVKSTSADFDIKKIYLEGIKGNYEDKEFESSRKKVWKERFQIFIAIMLLLICLEFLLTEKNLKGNLLKNLNKNINNK